MRRLPEKKDRLDQWLAAIVILVAFFGLIVFCAWLVHGSNF